MQIKEKIWLTSKTRMNSEIRLKRYDLYANILIISYSFTLICISIANSISPNDNLEDIPLVVLSLGVFTLSIIVYFSDFRGKAATFRECYLRLDKLNDTEKSEETLTKLYHEILHGYPNHADVDFYKLVIGNPLDKGHKINDAKGSPITPTIRKRIQYLLQAISVHIFFVVLLFFPIYFLHSVVN